MLEGRAIGMAESVAQDVVDRHEGGHAECTLLVTFDDGETMRCEFEVDSDADYAVGEVKDAG